MILQDIRKSSEFPAQGVLVYTLPSKAQPE